MIESGARFMDCGNDDARDILLANGRVLENMQIFHSDVHYT